MAKDQTEAEPVQPIVLDDRLPLTRMDEAKRLSLLVYGAPGTGKTVLAGTAADDERSAPVLFCDAEGGTASISWRDEGIARYEITDFSADMNRLVAYFRKASAEGNLPYKTVVIDSMTDVSWQMMSSMIQSPGRRGDPDALEYGEWNKYLNRIRFLVTFFRDLKIHLIATAVENTATDERGAQTIVPSVMGKGAREMLPMIFNTVGRLQSTPVPSADGKGTTYRRRLTVSSDIKFIAKDRNDPQSRLPKFIDDPTVTKLLDRIDAGRKAARLALKGDAPQATT